MTRTIRWGIIGVGDVTEVKSGPGFQKARDSALVAVMRRDGAKARDYAERHGVPRWYDDAQALIDDPDVDAVYIATPPDSHLDYTRMCAQAGKPVLVEKPMARTFAECQAMIDACAAASVPLWVAFYRRRLPRFVKVKELLDAGTIGTVRAVNVSLYRPMPDLDPANLPWRVVPEIAGGGIFMDLAPHTLDLLDYFFGPIETVYGLAANRERVYPAEEQVAAAFAFASGILGTGLWAFNAGHSTDHVEIAGNGGRLVFSTFEDQPVRLITPAGEELFDIPHPPHVHQPLIQSIVDELNGHEKCPSTGVSGARANWVTDQALSGYRAASSR